MTDNKIILQFAKFKSFVNSSFWHKFADFKLDFDRLSDAPKQIYGFYSNHAAVSCLLEVDYSAFNKDFKPTRGQHIAIGTIYNKNTLEEFKNCDKIDLLKEEGAKLLSDITSDRCLENPELLARFFILSFADLKCHSYYYWFCFPCPRSLTPVLIEEPMNISNLLCNQLSDILKENRNSNFFVLVWRKSGSYTVCKLSDLLNVFSFETVDDFYFCFADASEFKHPSWIMRNYAALVFYKCPDLISKPVKFIGLRFDKQLDCKNSIIWTVMQPEPVDFDNEHSAQFVGWELNQNNKMGPRILCMKESMDSIRFAENMVDLNLKLMKWRLLPELNLDSLKVSRCIIFGAGTLGCAVARNLLAWGFKHITFVDNGKVGFSNPVRQSLYTHKDAEISMKATTAALRVKEINPSAISSGHVLHIPMPGHSVGETLREETLNTLNKIKNLVEEHDVLFLLTDSRESRWLPTLLGAAFEKVVINAALGFDSYLIMRHGSSKETDAVDSNDIHGLKCINGAALGCYFCNDVIAPGNSLKDRTLDQQCTVTRPGVSNIAASYAVELLVSVLQHPERELAPAYFAMRADKVSRIPEGLLGIIPHSIRGALYNFENILPAFQKFRQCTACSEKVLSEYKQNGNNFIMKVIESSKYLEDLTGISDFNQLDNKVIDFEDSEHDMSDD